MNKKAIQHFLTIFMVLLFAFLGCVPALATENEAVTVRVAFCPLNGFFAYDENGNECGYGVDYLEELCKYENIRWEYVYVPNWEDIGPMMRAGTVDVRLPVSEPATPSQYYSYTTEAVLPSYQAIMTKKTREDLFYTDYETIAQMKIGIVTGNLEKTGMIDYLQSIGVYENLVYFDDYNACLTALNYDQVDGIISNVMDLTDDLKILDKFGVTKNYITTMKDSPYYSIINTAMTRLALENPTFQADLYEKYFPNRAVEPFTKEETEYIQNTDALTMAVYSDRCPVSYYDEKEGTFKGIAIDIAKSIFRDIGIEVNFVPVTTADAREMLQTADLVMPVAKSGSSAYFSTASVLDSEVLMVVRDGTNSLPDDARVGVLTSTTGIQQTMREETGFTLVQYGSSAQALKALQNGKIDGFANAAYVVNWLLENPRYNDVHILRYQAVPLEYSICGRAEDTALFSVLEKSIRKISEDERKNIIRANTDFSFSDLSLADRLYMYRTEIIVVAVVLAVLLVAALFYNHSRNQYVAEIESRSREQEKANRAKTDFLARMSHDMRTPMNGILGLSYIMEDETDIHAIKKELPQLRESGEYLLQLINDVLDVNKVESGNIELHPEVCDEERVFNAIIEMVKPLIDEKHIDFQFIKKNIKWRHMKLDVPRVKQIFVNLLSNAAKFTPEGGKIEFIMELVSEDEDAIVDKFIVRDNGIGMSPEFLPKVFEPFAQENRVQEALGGTGLGMAITKGLVELMGGTIHVESEMNQGTEFTLYLHFPLAKEVTVSAEQQLDETAQRKLHGTKILMCEDNRLNAQIAQRLLEKQGVAITWVQDGKEGVDTFAAAEPYAFDAVLMDIRMPVLDGVEATRAIRALARADAKTVPIIAMTANAYEEDVHKSLSAGMNAHLAKPINPKLLYNTIASFLP